jgi:ATP-dependent DNA helicase RecG
MGSFIAASGLVKAGKYGLTLDNLEIEVLDHSHSTIQSLKVGRVLPVYPLTNGVDGDTVRRAVVAALPAVQFLIDPLPPDCRQTQDLIDLQMAVTHIHYPQSTQPGCRPSPFSV